MLNMLFNIFFAFFMGQWEEYHTGAMMTGNGKYVGILAKLLCRGKTGDLRLSGGADARQDMWE